MHRPFARRALAGIRGRPFLHLLPVHPRQQELGDEPKLVMLENVTGFLTSKDGADFVKAVSTLAAEGYWIDCVVLDAKSFVPQSRPRVFVVGFHESLRSERIIRQGKGGLFGGGWQTAIDEAGSLRPDSSSVCRAAPSDRMGDLCSMSSQAGQVRVGGGDRHRRRSRVVGQGRHGQALRDAVRPSPHRSRAPPQGGRPARRHRVPPLPVRRNARRGPV